MINTDKLEGVGGIGEWINEWPLFFDCKNQIRYKNATSKGSSLLSMI